MARQNARFHRPLTPEERSANAKRAVETRRAKDPKLFQALWEYTWMMSVVKRRAGDHRRARDTSMMMTEVCCCFPDEQLAWLNSYAQRYNMPRSAAIRYACSLLEELERERKARKERQAEGLGE